MNKKFLIWDNAKDALLSLIFLLMIVGAVNVFSASFVAAADMFGNGYHYLIRYLIYGAAGLALMLVLSRLDYHKLFRLAPGLYGILFLLLLYVDLFGKATKGAQRWIILGPVSFQPSELVKLGVILFGAYYLGPLMAAGKKIRLLDFKSSFALWLTVVLALMVLKQPDMGTAAIILALMVVMYIAAGLAMSLKSFLLGTVGMVLVIAGMIYMAPYRLNRLQIWLHPEKDPQGGGYQAVQSFVAIGSGGFFGNSFGMGPSKFFFLPEAHTDFAFAVFCQEWGFVGAVLLLFVFLLLALVLYRIGKDTRDPAGFLLVTGVNFLVVGQAVANMAMVCGIFPVIGVPLSFISYGGTSLIATLMAMGLVFSVYRQEMLQNRKRQSEQDTEVQKRGVRR